MPSNCPVDLCDYWTNMCAHTRWKLHEDRVLISPRPTQCSVHRREAGIFVEENWTNPHLTNEQTESREMRNDLPKLMQLKWDILRKALNLVLSNFESQFPLHTTFYQYIIHPLMRAFIFWMESLQYLWNASDTYEILRYELEDILTYWRLL